MYNQYYEVLNCGRGSPSDRARHARTIASSSYTGNFSQSP